MTACAIMQRLPVCLALMLVAVAAGGTEVQRAAFAAEPFDARSVSPYLDLGLGHWREEYRWPAFSEMQVSCPADMPQLCGDDPPSTNFRDREGLKRDTYYFLGYQFVTIGVLYLMPENISSWSDEDKEEYSLSKWWDNVTHPIWDDDDFYLNYIMHPYWGATYFVRARERGYTNMESFWYSAMLSSMYEFGAEAIFEPVSIQDVIVTPVFGSLLGVYFMDVRQGIEDRSAERGYTSARDKWVLVLTDPLGVINRQVDKWLGVETDLQIHPYVQPYQLNPDAPSVTPQLNDEETIGLTVVLRW